MSKKNRSPRVLFTGGRAPYTLELVRLFHKSGYEVFVAESLKDNLAGTSVFTKKCFTVPPPAQHPEGFINSLKKIIVEAEIDLLIPTCEEVFYLAMAKPILEQYCEVFTAPIETLRILHSKYEFIEHLKKIGVHFPKTEVVDNLEELKTEVEKMGDFVIKPEFSRFGTLAVINDLAKISKITVKKDYRWVVQRLIRGKPYCSYSVVREGKVLATSIYPTTYSAGNAAVYFEAVNIPEIAEVIAKIAVSLNYTGQIAFDFIHSEKDNIYYPIECNPRATSGVYLFSPEDPLPLAFSSQKITAEKLEYRKIKPKMLFLAMLIYNLPKLKKFSEGKQFIKKIFAAEEAIFCFSDPKPFFVQFKSLFHYFLLARKNKISLLEASTVDIEWNGVIPK